MKVWQVQYKGHDIRVENPFRCEKLIVDGKIQDADSEWPSAADCGEP